MNIIEIIEKKKHGLVLSKEEIYFTIEGMMNGTIKDYQISALLMAICLKGMNAQETTDLTLAMRYSGDVLDLSSIGMTVVDKHSTGGVGDKTTLIVGPIMAELGVPVAKMSGRGLGITGGTIDKLDSIPGFSSDVSDEKFMELIKTVGMVDAAQTKNLAPADKYLYALRDVTGTVDSIPLIASSIMSKKLASGADAIVLDVKCGSGAFMKDEKSAKQLAKTMIDIAYLAGKECTAIISDMNQPLGYAVGNLLEVIEVVQFLTGKRQNNRLLELVIRLCREMYVLSDMFEWLYKDEAIKHLDRRIHHFNFESKSFSDTDIIMECPEIYEDAYNRRAYSDINPDDILEQADPAVRFCESIKDDAIDRRVIDRLEGIIYDFIQGGRAYKKFKEFIAAQGGDVRFIESLEDDEKVKEIFANELSAQITAPNSGIITQMDAELFGRASLELGAGRITKEADIDPLAGIMLDKTVGDKVEKGEVIGTIYSAEKEKIKNAINILNEAILVSEEQYNKE